MDKKRLIGSFTVIFCVLVTFYARADEDSEFKKKCRNCHEEKLAKWDMADIKHMPYSSGGCDSCHSSKHKEFTGKPAELCVICHDLADEKIKKAHFSANMTGVNCVRCHYTHGSDVKGLLKESTHMPFTSGMCDMCHKLDDKGKLEVKGDSKKICTGCHGNVVKSGEKISHMGYDMMGCTDCHDPHTTREAKLLKRRVSEICLDCHDKEKAAKHPYDVKPSKKITRTDEWFGHDGQVTCVSCHKPHASALEFLLKETTEDGKLCYECHKK